MKKITLMLTAAAALLAAGTPQTFIGTITDAMCLGSHAMMHVNPNAKCVSECVKSGSQYVLYDGKRAYKLSDQQTPAQFAARRVKVTGTLAPKTGIIQVEKIEGVE